MILKITNFLLGNKTSDDTEEIDNHEEVVEYEEGEWVIVSIHENPLVNLEVSPLENLLIEHPSMSVYQKNFQNFNSDNLLSEQENYNGHASRSPEVVHYISHHLILHENILPASHLHCMQKAKAYIDRQKLSRNYLLRQNQCKKRYPPKEKHYGNFKQPRQHFFNF
ncbi:si:ch211-260e23.9 [Polypterus senegalus]